MTTLLTIHIFQNQTHFVLSTGKVDQRSGERLRELAVGLTAGTNDGWFTHTMLLGFGTQAVGLFYAPSTLLSFSKDSARFFSLMFLMFFNFH